MKVAISPDGQLSLPADWRRLDGIEAGEEFEIERVDRGEYRLVRSSLGRSSGLVSWLLDCPEKDFFVPIESESTDTL